MISMPLCLATPIYEGQGNGNEFFFLCANGGKDENASDALTLL